MHEPEPAPDDPCRPEKPLDCLRVRIGGDVEIVGNAANEQVAHRSPDDIGMKPLLAQSPDHPEGILRNQARVYPVLIRSVDVSLFFYAAACRFSVSEKQFVDPK
jgi:hypothetical protein